MLKKIPLKKLNASFTPGSTPSLPIGIEFDCPTCRPFHRIRIGLNDQAQWESAVYRYSGSRVEELSLAPSIIGAVHYPSCHFKGWIKSGRLEWLHLEKRKVTRWENDEFRRV